MKETNKKRLFVLILVSLVILTGCSSSFDNCMSACYDVYKPDYQTVPCYSLIGAFDNNITEPDAFCTNYTNLRLQCFEVCNDRK